MTESKRINPIFAAFRLIEDAAIKGARCPQTDEFPPGTSSAIYTLADAGKIKIETYALNWRVVEITAGPAKGKRTAECPHGHTGPWRIRDQNGTRYPHQDAAWPVP